MKKPLACIVNCLVVSSLNAQTLTVADNSFASATYLIDVNQESHLNNKARALRDGGFETAVGDRIDFYKWYSPDLNEIHITWLTQLSKSFGVIWGIGTGEKADKYTIDPSLKIGFVYQVEFHKNNYFTLSGTGSVGGNFREHTCMADYGDIGGVREVNCRLAATEMPPEMTLNFLESGIPDARVQVSYKIVF
jgi:hypothetical protein